jgi:hypothetical protein
MRGLRNNAILQNSILTENAICRTFLLHSLEYLGANYISELLEIISLSDFP